MKANTSLNSGRHLLHLSLIPAPHWAFLGLCRALSTKPFLNEEIDF